MATDAADSSFGSSDPIFEHVTHIDPGFVGPENYEVYCQLASRLSVQDDIPQDAYRCVFTLGGTRSRVHVRLDDDHSLYAWFLGTDGVYEHWIRPTNPMTSEHYLGLVRGLLMTEWE